MVQRYALIIFDRGLVNKKPNHPGMDMSSIVTNQIQQAYEAIGLKQPSVKDIQALLRNGMNEKEILKQWAPSEKANELIEQYKQEERNRELGEFELLSYSMELLETLHHENYKIIVVGFRAPTFMRQILDKLGIIQYVNSVVETKSEPPYRLPYRQV